MRLRSLALEGVQWMRNGKGCKGNKNEEDCSGEQDMHTRIGEGEGLRKYLMCVRAVGSVCLGTSVSGPWTGSAREKQLFPSKNHHAALGMACRNKLLGLCE